MADRKVERTYNSSGETTGVSVSPTLTNTDMEDTESQARFQDTRGLGAAAKRIAAAKKKPVVRDPNAPESLAERAERLRKGKAAFDAARAEVDPR